jgi:3-oxoacyl-[acyl-carrier protein] reductase
MEPLSSLSRSIEGRVAIVTGAASGMGRATAMLFAEQGAKVAALDRNATALGEVVAAITSAGCTAEVWPIDLSDAEAIGPVVEEVRSRLGSIDILVNNAGIAVPIGIENDSYQDAWSATFAVNLDAHQRLIRLCLDDLLRDGEGRIVNVASTEGLGATALNSPYVAAKHGVVGLTRALAVELGRTGVTVNCVCPGPIRTGMTAAIPDEAKEKFARRRVPLRRYGDPEEVAQVTLSLVLPAASFLSGAIIPVDGGLRVQNT